MGSSADIRRAELPELDALRELVDARLTQLFTAADTSVAGLARAVEYSLLGAGKRIRPILCLACVEAFDGDVRAAVDVAAAVELIHAYSLVHDDLPAMDDDDLRRGMPTSHRVYGEDVAILVGDALQARAFELIAECDTVAAAARVDIVSILARAAGWQGMVGGQFLDVDASRQGQLALASLRDVHDRKTGALIAAAVEIGAVASGADSSDRQLSAEFGRELGWLFQLVDDLLDATGSSAALGKTPGKDARSGKVTAVDVFGGVAALRTAVDEQLVRCLQLARQLPGGGGRLPAIAAYVHGRDH